MRNLFEPLWAYSRNGDDLTIDMWNYNASDGLVSDYEKLLQKSHEKWIEESKFECISDKSSILLFFYLYKGRHKNSGDP